MSDMPNPDTSVCRDHRCRLIRCCDLFGRLLNFSASIRQGFLVTLELYARDESVVEEFFRLLIPFFQSLNFALVES